MSESKPRIVQCQVCKTKITASEAYSVMNETFCTLGHLHEWKAKNMPKQPVTKNTGVHHFSTDGYVF